MRYIVLPLITVAGYTSCECQDGWWICCITPVCGSCFSPLHPLTVGNSVSNVSRVTWRSWQLVSFSQHHVVSCCIPPVCVTESFMSYVSFPFLQSMPFFWKWLIWQIMSVVTGGHPQHNIIINCYSNVHIIPESGGKAAACWTLAPWYIQ